MARLFWHLLVCGIVVSASMRIGNEGLTDKSNPETTSEKPTFQTKSGPYVQRIDDNEKCDVDCAIILGLALSYIALVFAILWAIKSCAVHFRNLDSLVDRYFKEVAEYYRQEEIAHKVHPQFYV